MKRILTLALALIFNVTAAKAQNDSSLDCSIGIEINTNYAKSDSLHAIMKRYVNAGLPGTAIALYTDNDGWWAGAEGYANTEKRRPMQNCTLQYLQSISKSYMAVAIMQLHEEGKIGLDDAVTKYLPAKYVRMLENAASITVRMLLNHTSGVAEYSTDPTFVSYAIEHPTKHLTTDYIIGTIKNKKPMFAPGARHGYSNTNYELLAVIADVLIGNHAAYIAKNIFTRLKLVNTFYRNQANYLNLPGLTDSYWDVLNTGKPANVTAIQRANVASFIGDDGIVSTPVDAVKFLMGLFEGKLVSKTSLKEMQQWTTGNDGKPIYGLGLEFFEAGGIQAFGHAGAGIGAGCILLYIPVAKTYIFFSTNIGTLFPGDLPAKANKLKDELLAAILQ